MNYIQTGEIVAVHGIKGEVKVYPWADYPEFLEEFDCFFIQATRCTTRLCMPKRCVATKIWCL